MLSGVPHCAGRREPAALAPEGREPVAEDEVVPSSAASAVEDVVEERAASLACSAAVVPAFVVAA
jgi:hypothetical protein